MKLEEYLQKLEAALMMIELRENPKEAKKKLLRRFFRMKYGYSEADAANAVERISYDRVRSPFVFGRKNRKSEGSKNHI